MEKKIDNNKQTPKPRKNQPQKWNEKKTEESHYRMERTR